MEQMVLKNFYDFIFDFFNTNSIKIDCLEGLKKTDVLVIAVGTKVQITSLISFLNQGEEKPDHIYVVIQKNMLPMVQDLENEQCHFMGWQGPYTLDVISRITEEVDLSTVKHLIYQGRQPLDFRDVNLYDILLSIKEKYGCNREMRIYIQDILEEVYWYKVPEKIRRGMDVYQMIDAFLEA